MKGNPKKNKAEGGTEHSVIEPLHIYFSDISLCLDCKRELKNKLQKIEQEASN